MYIIYYHTILNFYTLYTNFCTIFTLLYYVASLCFTRKIVVISSTIKIYAYVYILRFCAIRQLDETLLVVTVAFILESMGYSKNLQNMHFDIHSEFF